jgi:hypothetical protein
MSSEVSFENVHIFLTPLLVNICPDTFAPLPEHTCPSLLACVYSQTDKPVSNVVLGNYCRSYVEPTKDTSNRLNGFF